jgi:hypothetical protein
LPMRLALIFWGGAIERSIAMNDFPNPAFIGSAALLAPRAIQGWLGHRSITSTAVYTALAPNRFKDFWRD